MALMGLLLRAQQARAAHRPEGHGLPQERVLGMEEDPQKAEPHASLVNKSRSDAKGLRERSGERESAREIPFLPSEIHPHRH